MFGAVIAPAKLPALRQLADDYQPDLIIHAEVDIAAPLLAAERGLASVTYGFAQPRDPICSLRSPSGSRRCGSRRD